MDSVGGKSCIIIFSEIKRCTSPLHMIFRNAKCRSLTFKYSHLLILIFHSSLKYVCSDHTFRMLSFHFNTFISIFLFQVHSYMFLWEIREKLGWVDGNRTCSHFFLLRHESWVRCSPGNTRVRSQKKRKIFK